MIFRVRARWAIAACAAAIALWPAAPAAQGDEILTNDAILQMTVGKVPKKIILAKIESTKNTFDISPAALVSLVQGKVVEDVMKAIVDRASDRARSALLANEGVILMVTGKVPKDIIVRRIKAATPGYDVSSSGLVLLQQNKVPQDVVKEMMKAAAKTKR